MKWGSVVRVTKRVLRIGGQYAPAIVAAYSPPLGALLGAILNGVVNAEATVKIPNSGSHKRDLALMSVQAAMPAIQALLEKTDKPIRNQELFAAGVEKMQEGIVDILNATGDGAKLPANG